MQTRKAQLKRAYSILSNAITRHRADTGTADYSKLFVASEFNTHVLYDIFSPYIKDLSVCNYYAASANPRCPEIVVDARDNIQSWDGTHKRGFGDAYSMLASPDLFITHGWRWDPMNIHVDINGKQKPNKYGMDIFMFYLSSAGVLSPAKDQDYWACDCGNVSDGWGMGACTHKALYDENYWKNPAMK